MFIRTTDTKAVLDKLFGKSTEEQQASFPTIARTFKHVNLKEYPFGIYTKHVPEYGMMVEIGFKGITNIVSFYLNNYPAYCGSRLFHNFSVKEQFITQEQLDEVMQTFFNENKFDGNKRAATDYDNPVGGSSMSLGRANRIEVIMVESRGLAAQKNGTADPMIEYEPIDNPNIQYKMLWNFFHKYSKRVRTRLEVNPNSGNLLHNMEVLF